MTWLGVLSIIGLVFFFLIMALALLSIVIGIPGTWIILAEALVYALITHFDQGIGWYDLLALLIMAGAGELAEFILTAYGAQKYGASKKAIAGALAGGLIGAILVNMAIPIIGALIGAFLGVYLGAFLITYYLEKDLTKSRQAGIGAFMGRLGAVLVKGTMGVAMAAVIITQIF
ncbi:MAG TPA: DUF456 domain-containing protein [bacterium]|nr:DUF456 domain-containing protein [bacterium]